MPEVWTITQIRTEFDLTTRSLRVYEEARLLKPERRGRRRIYSALERDKVAIIVAARDIGFSIDEIGKLLIILGLIDENVDVSYDNIAEKFVLDIRRKYQHLNYISSKLSNIA